ncbi:zona pellucida-like domain-containing protein 1 isoform X2 [Spea bombifrons]|uniref:zona pellucida-like domain-containing protein 1 isoform X2 n=1 Tax=Spea bombifrons TaxID=233779 RepID=UPI00234AE8A1|nr:zona pellucida-like domain-containing protein 1 isoform X2 [Spea bombifrons]
MSAVGTMSIFAILLLSLATQQCLGQLANCSSAYDRYPENTDIIVTCGPSTIELTINACPVQYALFDPMELALNGKHIFNVCKASVESTDDYPVAKFVFPINDTTENACGNSITIVNEQGSGIFSEYSNVQTVVISGYIDTPPLSENGLVSYSTGLSYNFSCRYPLQYLLNNTELLTSSASVAINTNNGSFISTLSMQLFTDEGFQSPLLFNGTALQLRKKIYVQVSAVNLTANFNVLLDQCFATPSPLVTTSPGDRYSLLTGCNVQNKTTVFTNGGEKSARFSFETFRFVQHSSQKTSTIYLHCITRLCQPDQCVQYMQSCNNTSLSRRKRAADSTSLSRTTDAVTVSSGPIYTTDQAVAAQASSQSGYVEEAKQLEGTLTGLIVGLIIAAMLGAALVFGSVLLFKMYRLKASQNEKNGVDNFAFSGK